jgi:excisionase family DNA binding protein
MLIPGPSPAGARLLLTPREAAGALSVCEKTLWSLTKRGELPAVRIGRSVRYDLADLRAFIEGRKPQAAQRAAMKATVEAITRDFFAKVTEGRL